MHEGPADPKAPADHALEDDDLCEHRRGLRVSGGRGRSFDRASDAIPPGDKRRLRFCFEQLSEACEASRSATPLAMVLRPLRALIVEAGASNPLQSKRSSIARSLR